MSETSDIVTPTLEALKRMGVIAWRVNAGGRTRRSVQAPPGTPDIIGALPPNGRLFGLEAKAGKGKLSEAQEVWHERARRSGVRVGVVRSLREATRLVRDWMDDEEIAAILREPVRIMSPGALLAMERSLDSTRLAGMRLAEPAPTPASKAKSPARTATRKTSGKGLKRMEVGK